MQGAPMTAGLLRAAGIAALAVGLMIGRADLHAEQPSTSTPPGTTRPATQPRTNPFARALNQRGSRLYRTPDMYGDFFASAHATLPLRDSIANLDLPPLGGGRRTKICETNRAIPTDRCYFLYDHFHNALEFSRSGLPGEYRSLNVDRFTFGIERAFQNGDWSVEVRLPMTTGIDLTTPATDPDLQLSGGEMGDLSVILKRLVYRSDDLAIAVGMGVMSPTGADARATLPDLNMQIDLHNDAVHLLPFIGLTSAPADWWFYHTFVQIDAATQGNRITVDRGLADFESGRLNDATLLFVDVGGGAWLFNDPGAGGLSGVAVIGELHYTRALQDPDRFDAVNSLLSFRSHEGDDFLNLTTGLHLGWRNWAAARIAGVFPLDLDDRHGRLFDAELQASVVCRF